MKNLIRKIYEADDTFVAPAGVTSVKVSIFQNNLQQIAANPGSAFVIDVNKDLWAWGSNINGDNTGNTRSSPVLVVGSKKWLQVGALGFNRVNAGGLTTDGDAYTWGQNNVGELGNNAAGAGINQSSPVLVVGGRKYRQFTVGGDNGLALQTNGLAVMWGDNSLGQLGDNTVQNRSSPVLVAGGRLFKKVFASGVGGMAIAVNGDAYCWGDNGQGNLGDNTTTNRSSPVLVVGGRKWQMLAGEGGSNFAGITTDGDLYMCGGNNLGQLGMGDIVNRSSPTLVPGGKKWKFVAVHSGGAWGITRDGVAYVWGGSNTNGTQGNNTISNRSTPTLVAGNYKFFQIPGVVSGSSAFLASDGNAYSAGSAGGQGDNNGTIARSSPTLVVGNKIFNAKKETFLNSMNISVVPGSSYAISMFSGSSNVSFASYSLGNYYGLIKMVVEYYA